MAHYPSSPRAAVVVFILAFALIGCTPPSPTQLTSIPAPTASLAKESPTQEATHANTPAPVRIKMWSIGVEADATHRAFANAVSTYNAKHSDVQIDITYMADDSFKTQLQVAIAAGDPPDIFQDWGGGVLKSMVDEGVVREIKALSGDAGKLWRPAALSPSTFDGRHYSVPVDLIFVSFFYNKDLFTKHGVELPTTWPKFLEACRAFRSVGITPAVVGNKQRWPGALYMDYLINRIGGQAAYERATYGQDDGGKFTDPPFVQAWTHLEEAVKAGCFEEGINGGVHTTDAGTLLMTDKAAMQLQGNWHAFFFRSIDEATANNKIGILPFPAFEDGVGNPSDLMGGTGQAMAISAKAPPEADSALIEMLGSRQFAKDLADAGLIPTTEGSDELLGTDPLTTKMLELLNSAPSIHLLYGTDLPPKLIDSYWNTTQQALDLVITPEQAASAMQAVAQSLGK